MPKTHDPEPWSSHVGSNPGLTYKPDGKDKPLDGSKNNDNNKEIQMEQVTQKIKKKQLSLNI